MVNGFFPAPYPDECLYSILCRYCVRIGCTGLKPARKLLFGGQACLASSIFFPIRLNLVKRWYGSNSGITRKVIAEKHTMHPYVMIVYPDKFRQEVDAVIRERATPKTFDKTGTGRSHKLWPTYLRYCPECVRDDVKVYGETYWHRAHQLPAMMYCTKHHMRLCNSEVEVIGSRMGFHPASAEPLSDSGGEYDSLAPYKEQFIRIGLESEWLLEHGVDIDWEDDLHQKYKRHLREKGIATIQGVSDYDLIADSFERYWEQDFLNCLKAELSDSQEWIREIYEARMVSWRPIYHILLMCFLCGSVETFLLHDPPENPFGAEPWPCENPICNHYLVDGCRTTGIRYQNGIATGFFKCAECGLVYKQVKSKGKTGNTIIVEYGDMWIERMMRCLRDEKRGITGTAMVLKCEPHIVKWQMKKLRILNKPEYRKKIEMYNRETGGAAHYKAQVLALCEQYDEVTSDILMQYAPGAYKYLYKFDLEWLHEHMTLQVNTKFQHNEDAEMLTRVQDAVTGIYSDGIPLRQITPAFIAVTAGYGKQALHYLAEKRPLTKAYVDMVVESRADWLRRRISSIAQECKVRGEKISIADVKREMSLKPNSFVKYEKFLKELIDELNE